MKERPIIFSTPMVQAILEGRKTQTRRIMKHPERSMDPCPYGMPGDVLWVREAFRIDGHTTKHYLYKSDKHGDGKYKPSIHMPKSAARIWLRITDIKAQRVHDISSADIIAEGVRIPVDVNGHVIYEISRENSALSFVKRCHMIDHSFWAELWCDINGRESWDANPWVWVIEFERCEKPITLNPILK